MEHVRVLVRRARASLPELPLPAYETDGAAGMDLRADVDEPILLRPGERGLVPTGLILALPPGYEGQVRPRSGLALRSGITLLNAPGTVDSDYRGEVQVLLANLGAQDFWVRRGDRIAQLVVAPVARAVWVETEDLPPSERGDGGFGHTGVGPSLDRR